MATVSTIPAFVRNILPDITVYNIVIAVVFTLHWTIINRSYMMAHTHLFLIRGLILIMEVLVTGIMFFVVFRVIAYRIIFGNAY